MERTLSANLQKDSGFIFKRYEKLLDMVQSRREQLNNLVSYLKDETPFEYSPASTRFHLAYKHGLLEHSVNVAETLLKIRELSAYKGTKLTSVVTIHRQVGGGVIETY